MTVNYHSNGMLIIPDKARVWGHFLNENYTYLHLITSLAAGDDSYLRYIDYADISEDGGFLYFKSEGGFLSPDGKVLSSLQHQGATAVESAQWQTTYSVEDWGKDLLLDGSFIQGDVYYSSISIPYGIKPDVLAEAVVYQTLSATTPYIGYPLGTEGALNIIGGDVTSDAYILFAYVVSAGPSITAEFQGASVAISPIPVLDIPVPDPSILYVYLGLTELQLYYAATIPKIFNVSFSKVP